MHLTRFIGKIAFYNVNMALYESCARDDLIALPKIMFTLLPVLPTTFFLMAVIINSNIWCFYYFKIGDMAS